MNFRFNGTHLMLALLILSACGGSSPTTTNDARINQVPKEEVTLPGSLYEAVLEINKSEYAEPCDLALADVKQNLVKTLENHLNSEKTTGESPTPTSLPPGAKLIPFQGSVLQDLPKAEPQNRGWETGSISWSGVNNYYETNKGNPPANFWSRLNGDIRSLLLEDRSRVINGTNAAFDHQNIEYLNSITGRIRSCVENKTCVDPGFNESELLALKSIPKYQFFQQALRSSTDRNYQRKVLDRFLERANRDLADHQLEINPLIKIKKNGTISELTLAMDPGTLNEEEKNLVETVIESIWSKSDAKVILEWRSRSTLADLFKILFHGDEPGERPRVKFRDKTLNLYPGSRTRSIAHEFGHVLGFEDHYYTTWNPNYCIYVTEFNDADLMSNSMSGDVTAEEWMRLLSLEEKPSS